MSRGIWLLCGICGSRRWCGHWCWFVFLVVEGADCGLIVKSYDNCAEEVAFK